MGYSGIAIPVREGHMLGAVFLSHWMMRAEAGIFGPNKAPRPLVDAAWIDGGYTLDAPEAMPAGACRSFTVGDDMPQMAEQMLAEREPHNDKGNAPL